MVEHRTVEANGMRLHVALEGTGPLVVLLHGFPETWYSWRHQFAALAAAGYRVAAPDQRGFGESERPSDVGAHTVLDHANDVLALIAALGEEQAVVVGHDHGGPVAWTTAQLRPDVVRGVAGLSVPPLPRSPGRPLASYRAVLGEGFYQLYFQQPGVADAELAADPRATIRRMLVGASGDVIPEGAAAPPIVPEGKGFLDLFPTVDQLKELPGWLTEEDIDVFARAFEGPDGFTGGLGWYRNADRNWELTRFLEGVPVSVPALYVAGDRDIVTAFPGVAALIPRLREVIAPGLTETVWLPGCGHWTQQERPDEVNAALLRFLAGLS